MTSLISIRQLQTVVAAAVLHHTSVAAVVVLPVVVGMVPLEVLVHRETPVLDIPFVHRIHRRRIHPAADTHRNHGVLVVDAHIHLVDIHRLLLKQVV